MNLRPPGTSAASVAEATATGFGGPQTSGVPEAACTRRRFLQTCAATGAGLSAGPRLFGQAPAAPQNRPPNILIISTDQWHHQVFSHLGYPGISTPHSDRIAQRSVRFSRSYAADPVCAPSRTSWITGRMPIEHGVIGNGHKVLPDIPDMGQWFSRHGYETAHFGKWHTSGRNPRKSHDHNHGMHPAGQYGDLSVAQMASAFLRGRHSRKPFLAHVAFMNPHDICQASCFYTGDEQLPIEADQLPPLPDNFHARPDEPGTLLARVRNSHRRAMHKTWTDTDWRLYRWMYLRYCEMVDLAIGQVLDAFEASGEADRTLLLYTSDHGEGMGHHGLFTKAFMYESAARVPFYLALPGHTQPNTQNDSIFTSGIDLLPTCCAAADLPPPPNLCGRDILAQYRGDQPTRQTITCSASFGGQLVRDDRYKLIAYRNDPRVQLFDLQDDPDETVNLAPNQPRLVQQLRQAGEDFSRQLIPAPRA
ncbi:MAG: sulfatase-like hydrolase/transferase [Planctomycetota bacterium]